ncbi:pyridoxal-phosphate dependent enzyme [Candidatus Woesearchaeota archaeon]|nr:pyridoxal-phosphate dependent enzyme [Candidatus Woesearchaeota archaeon]
MDPLRQQLYDELEARIGNTPLVQYAGELPNNNRLFLKQECDNPFGSHYDRVYVELFREFEEHRGLTPGSKVLETTSGTAGTAFAGIGRVLGYECHVAIPEGVDEAIVRVTREHGATIYRTPENEYVSGFPNFLREFLPQHRDFYFLNHSMGKRAGAGFSNNGITLQAFEAIAYEIMQKVRVDIYMPAVGNGSTVLGVARALSPKTKTIPFESVQAAVMYDQKYPGRYEQRFGIKPGTLPRHRLRGTSYQGIDFPHIKHAVEAGLISDAMLVSDRWQDHHYQERTGRKTFKELPHWDQTFTGYEDAGRSTRAGIACAIEVAKSVKDQNIVILAYDKADRYDSEAVIPY